jgi:hypothetical protein
MALTPTPSPTATPAPQPTPPPGYDDTAHHEVVADSGQQTINAATSSSPAARVTSTDELDALRLEVIWLRRFLCVGLGVYLGWSAMLLLFKYH